MKLLNKSLNYSIIHFNMCALLFAILLVLFKQFFVTLFYMVHCNFFKLLNKMKSNLLL